MLLVFYLRCILYRYCYEINYTEHMEWKGWEGKAFRFFDAHKDIDIFCLQEILSAPPYELLDSRPVGGFSKKYENMVTDVMQEISKVLPNHVSYFHPHHLDNYGLQILVKKDVKVVEEGDIFVHKYKGYVPEDGILGNIARNIQYVTLETSTGRVTVINFHGLWNGKGKTDTEERIHQSKNIIEFTKNLTHDFILCGDFNLLPETKSIEILESSGLSNLIKKYNITSTRTSFYTKQEKHANYVFVTKGIKVKEFKVLPEEVSDHTPLLLEFD